MLTANSNCFNTMGVVVMPEVAPAGGGHMSIMISMDLAELQTTASLLSKVVARYVEQAGGSLGIAPAPAGSSMVLGTAGSTGSTIQEACKCKMAFFSRRVRETMQRRVL